MQIRHLGAADCICHFDFVVMLPPLKRIDKMDKVVNIEDHKKHVNIYGERIHVLPLSLFESIVNKETSIIGIDDIDDIAPVIIAEWLDKDNKKLKIEVEKLKTAIRNTLNENLDLCDGDQCTLLELKRSIGFD